MDPGFSCPIRTTAEVLGRVLVHNRLKFLRFSLGELLFLRGTASGQKEKRERCGCEATRHGVLLFFTNENKPNTSSWRSKNRFVEKELGDGRHYEPERTVPGNKI